MIYVRFARYSIFIWISFLGFYLPLLQTARQLFTNCIVVGDVCCLLCSLVCEQHKALGMKIRLLAVSLWKFRNAKQTYTPYSTNRLFDASRKPCYAGIRKIFAYMKPCVSLTLSLRSTSFLHSYWLFSLLSWKSSQISLT